MKNPFLEASILVHNFDYAQLRAEHFCEAFDQLIPALRAEHEARMTVLPLSYSVLFENDLVSRQLSRVSDTLQHLISVAATEQLREVYGEYMPLLVEVGHELSMDERAYHRLMEYKNSVEFDSLDSLKQQVVTRTLDGLEREGISLPASKKERLGEIAERIETLATAFDLNLTEFNNQASLEFTREQLAGVPASTLRNATLLPNGNYVVTKLAGGFYDISISCDNAETRKAVYDYGLAAGTAIGLDNRPILEELVVLAHEKAGILGFDSYAKYSLHQLMAKSSEDVQEFIRDLADRSLPKARQDMRLLEAFGSKLLGRPLEHQDVSYVFEKMRTQAYNVDFIKLREYFPIDKVLRGTMEVLSEMFGIHFIVNSELYTWDSDVVVVDVIDTTTSTKFGTVYLDLFARENKDKGAWTSPALSRHTGPLGTSLPVSYIVCNFPKSKGQKTTLDFSDVSTLLHEFGHALHNVLTDVEEEFFSGFGNVQHDAIELPSQFMENFLYDYSVLVKLSRNINTGEVLPEAIFNSLKQEKFFMAAQTVLARARLSLIDMRIYSEPGTSPQVIENEVMDAYAVRERDSRSSDLPTFSHIFSGGYAAGYYAYQWAEAYSADAYATLHAGDSQSKALSFREHILASGGVSDMASNFHKFCGRPVELTPLLADYGLV